MKNNLTIDSSISNYGVALSVIEITLPAIKGYNEHKELVYYNQSRTKQVSTPTYKVSTLIRNCQTLEDIENQFFIYNDIRKNRYLTESNLEWDYIKPYIESELYKIKIDILNNIINKQKTKINALTNTIRKNSKKIP